MLLNCPHMERAGIHNHPGVIGKPMKILHFHFWPLCSFRKCPYSKFYLTTRRGCLLLHGDFDLLEICIHQFGSLPKEDSLLLGWNSHIHMDENLPEIEGVSLLNPSIITGSSSLPEDVPAPKKAKPLAKPLAIQQTASYRVPKPPLLGSSLAKLGVTVPHDTCQSLPTIKQQVWKEVNTDSGIIHMKHWPQRRRGRITTILAGSSNIIPRESPPNPQQIQVGEFLLKFTHIPV